MGFNSGFKGLRNADWNVAFFTYNYSENAEYDTGVKYSSLTIYVVHVLFFVVRIRRLHTV